MSPNFLTTPLFFQAQSPGDQIFSHRSGFRGHLDEPMEVALGALIGAMAGFLLGMPVSAVLRVIRIDRVESSRMRVGWATYGAAAGSIGLAVWKAID